MGRLRFYFVVLLGRSSGRPPPSREPIRKNKTKNLGVVFFVLPGRSPSWRRSPRHERIQGTRPSTPGTRGPDRRPQKPPSRPGPLTPHTPQETANQGTDQEGQTKTLARVFCFSWSVLGLAVPLWAWASLVGGPLVGGPLPLALTTTTATQLVRSAKVLKCKKSRL